MALLGVSPALSEPALSELEDCPSPGFVLSVGTREPRQNLARLVAAYSAAP